MLETSFQNKFKNNNKAQKDEFLMSALEIDNLQNGPRKPEKFVQLNQLDKRINELVGGERLEIFKILAENKQTDNQISDLLVEDIEEIKSNYSLDVKLIDLPETLVAKILKPLSRTIRQRIYVQRDKISLKDAIDVYEHWTKKTIIAYHTSPVEIKGNFLNAQNHEIYFSTDIQRLFNRHGTAKYIYAFRISTRDNYSYGALDCFGKMSIQGSSPGVEIEDVYRIFDPKDPTYQTKALNAIGAKFADYFSK